MRDIERIDRIIEKLREHWHAWPDQRLGQVVSNLMGPGPHDVFGPDDDQWEAWLDVAAGREPETHPLHVGPNPFDAILERAAEWMPKK